MFTLSISFSMLVVSNFQKEEKIYILFTVMFLYLLLSLCNTFVNQNLIGIFPSSSGNTSFLSLANSKFPLYFVQSWSDWCALAIICSGEDFFTTLIFQLFLNNVSKFIETVNSESDINLFLADLQWVFLSLKLLEIIDTCIKWLIDWLIGWLIDWLSSSLINWLIYLLID